MAQPLLETRDVSFRYAASDWRLDRVGFALGAGDLLAVIGPNGSGKSTLLKLAAGVLAPAAGQVRLAGAPLGEVARRRVAKTLGYLPQQFAFGYDYTVEETVAMGRFPHLSGMGFLGAHDARAIDRVLEQTETAAYRRRRLSHLSGGERQRVFLASVLAQAPRVLLLDEPTSSLDIHHQARFFGLIRSLAADGLAVAVVTHDLNLASFYCPRALLLAGGRLLASGPTEAVLQPETLSRAYGDEVTVLRDTPSGRPVVLPVLLERAGGPP
jgi:iron complex transport system ATP-binding protein